MSDLVDLIENGDLPRPNDRAPNRKPHCSHCVKNGQSGEGHMIGNCPLLGRPSASRRGKK